MLCYCVLCCVAIAHSAPDDRKIDGVCEKCDRNIVIKLSPYETKDGQTDPAKYGLRKGMSYEQVIKTLGKPKTEDIQDFFRHAYYPDGLMIYFARDPAKKEYTVSYCENTDRTIICPYCGRAQDWRKAANERANDLQKMDGEILQY